MQTVLLLLAVLCAGNAFVVEDTNLQTFLANGTQGAETQWQQNSVTFQCSSTDFQDVSEVVGNVSYAITCKPPLYEFTTTLRQFVPHQIRQYTAEYCYVNSNATTTSPYNTGFTTAQGLTAIDGGSGGSNLPLRHLLSVFSSIADTFTPSNVLCGITLGTSDKYCGQCSCPPPSFPTLNDIEAVIGQCPQCSSAPFTISADELAADAATMRQLLGWINTQLAENEAVVTVQQKVNDSITEFVQAAAFQEQQFGRLNSSIQILAAGIDQNVTYDTRQITNLFQDLLTEAGLQSGINQRQQLFENATAANFASINSLLSQIATNTSNFLVAMLGKIRATTQYGRQSGAQKGAQLSMTTVRRQLTRQLFVLAAEAIASDLKPFWDPSQSGQAPVAGNIDPSLVNVDLDIDYINLINTTQQTGQNVAHQYRLEFACNAMSVLQTFVEQATWIDVMELIGPAGCAATQTCNCYIKVNHQQCPVASSFNWQQITGTGVAPFLLQSNCAPASITNGPWDGRQIDDIAVLNVLLGQLCSTQLAAPAVSCTSNCPRQIQIVSTRMGVLQNVVAPALPSQVCGANYNYIFYVNPNEQNLFTSLFTIWIQANNLLLADSFELETQFFGILPNYITYINVPFQVLQNPLCSLADYFDRCSVMGGHTSAGVAASWQ
jgi:hypothetical protein